MVCRPGKDAFWMLSEGYVSNMPSKRGARVRPRSVEVLVSWKKSGGGGFACQCITGLWLLATNLKMGRLSTFPKCLKMFTNVFSFPVWFTLVKKTQTNSLSCLSVQASGTHFKPPLFSFCQSKSVKKEPDNALGGFSNVWNQFGTLW